MMGQPPTYGPAEPRRGGWLERAADALVRGAFAGMLGLGISSALGAPGAPSIILATGAAMVGALLADCAWLE